VNLADVKNELSSDEKILESAFKLETLYKKHKIKIWAVAVALLLFFGGRAALQAINDAKLAAANEAFLALQSNPDDANALKTLKEKNPALYELYSYAKAAKAKDLTTLKTLQKSSNGIVSDVSGYHAAVLEKKPSESKLYRDMALIEEAYLDIKAGKAKEAKEKLSLIGERSPAAVIAQFLRHSTIKAK
jgi:hypothetical protein